MQNTPDLEQAIEFTKRAVENHTRDNNRQPSIYDAIRTLHALKNSRPSREIIACVGAALIPFLANTDGVELHFNYMRGHFVANTYWPCFASLE